MSDPLALFADATGRNLILDAGQPTDSAVAWALVLGRYCDQGVAVTGSVEVGVDFPQSREFKPCAQFADREGTERDHMFVRLNLAAVAEDKHQMGDVLVAEAIRYLPGIEHQASPPPASHHPVCQLDDLALGMKLLPVTGINHHMSPGTGHPP
jgi:hypothetical protein